MRYFLTNHTQFHWAPSGSAETGPLRRVADADTDWARLRVGESARYFARWFAPPPPPPHVAALARAALPPWFFVLVELAQWWLLSRAGPAPGPPHYVWAWDEAAAEEAGEAVAPAPTRAVIRLSAAPEAPAALWCTRAATAEDWCALAARLPARLQAGGWLVVRTHADALSLGALARAEDLLPAFQGVYCTKWLCGSQVEAERVMVFTRFRPERLGAADAPPLRWPSAGFLFWAELASLRFAQSELIWLKKLAEQRELAGAPHADCGRRWRRLCEQLDLDGWTWRGAATAADAEPCALVLSGWSAAANEETGAEADADAAAPRRLALGATAGAAPPAPTSPARAPWTLGAAAPRGPAPPAAASDSSQGGDCDARASEDP